MAFGRKKLTFQEQQDRDFLKACDKGNLARAEELLAAEANINAADGDGKTAVFYAVAWGENDLLKFLIEKKADLDAPCAKHIYVTDYTRLRPGETPLVAACRLRHYGIASQLLKAGADLHASDEEGRTALHHAAKNGDFPLVRALVEAGADISALDIGGNKPESLAKKEARHGIADYLRDLTQKTGATPEAVALGWTLLAPQEVMCVTAREKGGYRLTDIFNFESGERTRIVRNLGTGAESNSVQFFADFPDRALLEKAQAELEKLGGTAAVPVRGKKSPTP